MSFQKPAPVALKVFPWVQWFLAILAVFFAAFAVSCGGTNHPALATHAAYVTLPTQGSVQLLRINNATGEITADAQTPPVAGLSPKGLALHPSKKFLYVVNSGADSISQFNIASDGTLTASGSATPTGSAPFQAVIDPTGQYLLVTNTLSDNVSVFSIDSGTGALTPAPRSPVYANPGPSAIAITPSGSFVFVTNPIGYVTAFSFSGGVLIEVPKSPFAADRGDAALVVDATGKYLYTANTTANNVSGFSIDGSSGALSPLQNSPYTSAAGSQPSAIAIDPTNSIVYVTTPGSSFSIWAFSINQTTGVLAPVPSSPFNLLSGGGLFVVMEPSGSFFYVANQGSQNVAGYSYNSGTGTPSAITNSPFKTVATPGSMVIVH